MSSDKQKIDFEGRLATAECADYLAAIVEGLRAGRLTFRQGDEALSMVPPGAMQAEVKAKRKGDQHMVAVELSWRGPVSAGVPRGATDDQLAAPVPRDAAADSAILEETVTVVEDASSDDEVTQTRPRRLGQGAVRKWLAERSREELYEKAQSLGLPGRSQLSKDELIHALARTYTPDQLFTLEEVYERAKLAEVAGRSSMSKDELLAAL